MAKNTPFFKFDSSAWLGGSIQFTDLASKGLFIDLCALYWESQKPVKIDTKFKVRVRCDEGTLSNLLDTLSDLDIIAQSEHGITVPFLDSLMSDRNEWLEKCSKAGKKSSSSKGTSSNKKEESRKKKEEDKKTLWLSKAKPEYLEFCEMYYLMLESHGKINSNTNWKTKAWYDAARLMVEADGNDLDTMGKALNFISKRIADEFCPQAWSVPSLREKWIKLREYSSRFNSRNTGEGRANA